MGEKILSFSATSGALAGKTVAVVSVWTDRILIERETRRNLPRNLLISFSDISSIAYSETKSAAWIMFTVPGNSPVGRASAATPVYAVRPGEIVLRPAAVPPFDDPYAIIFPKAEKKEAAQFYQQIMDMYQEFRSSLHTPSPCAPICVDELKELKCLFDEGALTADEYRQAKQKLLNNP